MVARCQEGSRGTPRRPGSETSLLAANRRGIALMSSAMSVFIVNDMLIKIVGESLPASQVIGLRGLMASLWIGVVMLASTPVRELRWLFEPHLLGRCMLDVLGTFTYIWALFALPIATATAINMSTPIFITVMAVLWLRESVGWRRWSAVAAGFVGVMLIVRPSPAGLNWWALLAFGATGVHAFRDVIRDAFPATYRRSSSPSPMRCRSACSVVPWLSSRRGSRWAGDNGRTWVPPRCSSPSGISAW